MKTAHREVGRFVSSVPRGRHMPTRPRANLRSIARALPSRQPMNDSLSGKQIFELSLVLSAPRLARYVEASHRNRRLALSSYRWNAEVSAAMMVPLHLCEVILRNAISEAIENVYGPNWWVVGSGFERSLPHGRAGYSAVDDLNKARAGHATASKVIPDLKFMFWVTMFTSRHDGRLWNPLIKSLFPNLPPSWGPSMSRRVLYQQLDAIRILRNRIAHHEPIFMRDLAADYRRLQKVVSWRSKEASRWMDSFQTVTAILARKP
jgi:hypothetical protein